MLRITNAGLATTSLVANRSNLTLDFDVPLFAPCKASSPLQPQYTLTYQAGIPVLNGSAVFVPITAVLTIVQAVGKCGCARTKIYSETFNVSFQGQTATPASVTIASVGRIGSLRSFGTCAGATRYGVTDSITVTLG